MVQLFQVSLPKLCHHWIENYRQQKMAWVCWELSTALTCPIAEGLQKKCPLVPHTDAKWNIIIMSSLLDPIWANRQTKNCHSKLFSQSLWHSGSRLFFSGKPNSETACRSFNLHKVAIENASAFELRLGRMCLWATANYILFSCTWFIGYRAQGSCETIWYR